MWFKFPQGTTEISIQQQRFVPEHTDSDGNLYFRAPNHFAPHILQLKGFGSVSQPDGAVDDLDPNDRERNDAISNLSGTVTQLQQELADAKAGLIAVNRDLQTKERELNETRAMLQIAEMKIKELEEALEDKPGKK